ncbi:hypothetical protein AYO41_01165 [Verrucomicrobia bacterium SCGC AG-212-E04]|nr:hypothetical protein AYO41_01165 [Verrucomicrobia bacterium SCGC AG-212-E04]
MSADSSAQIIFNTISAAEIAQLPKMTQLELLTGFKTDIANFDQLDPEKFGVIRREGKKLRRYRMKDYRVYFERVPEGLTIHRILHRNTLADFFYRSNLPLAEDEQLGEAKSFWKLIEEGEKAQRKP